MKRSSLMRFLLVMALVLTAMLVSASVGQAGHTTDPRTSTTLVPRGHIVEPASLLNADIGNTNIHTDIAFWGEHAFQGTWVGFNIRDISKPGNPKQVSFTSCEGNQGDIVVWDDILVRSWNTPAGTPGLFGAGLACDGEAVAPGFEGLHVFDISDPTDPVLVAQVATECGSHTATGVPDLANDRLLIYNSPSDVACPGIDIVEVPLNDPASAAVLRFERARRPCHDTGVILGDAMLAACAGGDGFTVWSLGAPGGSLKNPKFLYSRSVPDVSIGHSAGFSWDGEIIVFGHEPGGGIQAECEAGDADVKKSAMFFEAATGNFLGQWTLPRAQTVEENCTIHNYNVVPLPSGNNVLVMGNYQAGTWVADFTDPTSPVTLGWSDPPPAPVPPPPGDFLGRDIVGAWSSYWYNDHIHETNIGEGLNIFKFKGPETAGALQLDHLNPQTQEFTIP